ncbi:MAG: hypothetical protein WCQ50_13495 [Spirochaetota bacterium]
MRITSIMLVAVLALRLGWAEGEASGGEGQPAAEGEGPAVPGSTYDVRASIDWSRRVLELRVSLDLRSAGLRLPEGRLAAERMVSRDLPGLAKNPFFAIPVDSRRSVGDTIVDGTVDSSAILDLSALLVRREDSLSKDLRFYLSVWELPLVEAAKLFISHSTPSPLPQPLEWTASKAWSGIVITAEGPLPVHGERDETDHLSPGLFPRIFDADMNLIVDRSTVDPELLASQGPLAYASTFGPSERARVGDTPLRIRARELFGIHRTDLVISREDALKILSSPENRKLVVTGRILVITGR